MQRGNFETYFLDRVRGANAQADFSQAAPRPSALPRSQLCPTPSGPVGWGSVGTASHMEASPVTVPLEPLVTPQEISGRWRVQQDGTLPNQFVIAASGPRGTTEWILFDMTSDPTLSRLINGARDRALREVPPNPAAPGASLTPEALERRAGIIHDHIRENMPPCQGPVQQSHPGEVVAAGPILECRGVCRDQAPALALALQRAGINAVIRRGAQMIDGVLQPTPHMWVEIQMPDGSIRIVDTMYSGMGAIRPTLEAAPNDSLGQRRIFRATSFDGIREISHSYEYAPYQEESRISRIYVPPEAPAGTSQRPLCRPVPP